ncbi:MULTISPECIES: P1 family peptidase [unclassified Imperialibacter]|uniref:DmpA family aminopeptidase n=1 Tax=unclassified Imperialibacter TaxID=2629706 RepID=UPI0012553C30|nr:MULTISPECIES: P1 family peptidase [unclassified Imperialibacter]CAD5257482.1 Beta-peptidyl aminopeptidase BapA [Imperialibacter sp. 75]CAD5260387.1 Beta-peptidyl aminopeptidase BapA [Imperialibacter sp. 89]VVT25566.1 Beta-peptidyl aminopeptidase BapA [Imperialibacter sp. EC-SDR9]
MSRLLLLLFCMTALLANARQRAVEVGVKIGVLPSGEFNAITDVKGVKVGHFTLIQGDDVRTGVTSILPYDGNIFQSKVPAAIYLGNAFGKLAGYTQVKELGNIETPILLTNTLAVADASKALVRYTLALPGNENVRSVNPVVGETNDSYLNDIRSFPLQTDHFAAAINAAKSGEVEEGNVGAGTGTVCFGYKGGIGSSSRKLPESLGGYTVGVLVQTNFGGNLTIDGEAIDEMLEQYPYRKQILGSVDGSCMIVVATDAPLDARNLERLAKRALLGLGRTGGIASNGSGDYVIAFSTAEGLRVPYDPPTPVLQQNVLANDSMTPLFMGVIEATEEAIVNSLWAANTMTGYQNHTVEALPKDKVMDLLKKSGKIKK